MSPGEHVGIAGGRCWELLVCDSLASAGEDHRVVGVFVRINADDHCWSALGNIAPNVYEANTSATLPMAA